MARKVRELKAELRRAGCRELPGRGSHTKWTHAALPAPVVLSGHDGDDAQPYQESAVRQALARIAAARRTP
jgi:predicted RNA binding protein YcfA (HicA-like mRNA interferase family)